MPPFNLDAYCDKLAKAGTEHAHQRAFFALLAHPEFSRWHPLAWMCYAIPNGGIRNIVTASRLKAEGVKPGIPDVHYPVPRGIDEEAYHSLYMELKAGKGTTSEDQQRWHHGLRLCGHAVAVCWGWRAARLCFEDYATGQPVAQEYHA